MDLYLFVVKYVSIYYGIVIAMYISMYIHIYIYIHVYIHTYDWVCVYVYIYTYIYIYDIWYVYVYVCVIVCVTESQWISATWSPKIWPVEAGWLVAYDWDTGLNRIYPLVNQHSHGKHHFQSTIHGIFYELHEFATGYPSKLVILPHCLSLVPSYSLQQVGWAVPLGPQQQVITSWAGESTRITLW